ncbi:MAG: pimeloyl-ACP methyl ester carboxylesterase [Myxococcota bacterium]|jgi:pimeloyl-ACP methyl ester carboxylesterase
MTRSSRSATSFRFTIAALFVFVALASGCGDDALDQGFDGLKPVEEQPGSGNGTPDSTPPDSTPPVETEEPIEPIDRELPVSEPIAEEPTVCGVCEDVPALDSLTTYPIVLAHGMAGFNEFGPIQYWVGVEERLRSLGYAVYVAVVDPLNGSDVRGKQLAAYIDRVLACTCAEKVNIIAHSQGGIDSRVVVDAMGYGDRVASVTTIATPHRGSLFSDIGLGLVPGNLDPIINFLGWMLAEVYTDPLEEVEVRATLLWMSTEHLENFANDYPTDTSVDWISYAGRAGITALGWPECVDVPLPNPVAKAPLTLPLLATWTLLGGLAGVDNDGLVTVDSSKWGDFRGCLPADHIQEIGMFIGVPQVFDHLAFFQQHVELLVARGH